MVRTCSRLPPDAANYYRSSIRYTLMLFENRKIFLFISFRKEYEQHCEEDDPERIQQIMDRAVKDAEWILKKYTNK